MKCPFCSSENTRVIDSRPADDNNSIRRRRLCDECGKRFTTYEKVETIPLIVMTMTWKGFGGTAIMYLASLQGVNQELYEAAIMDGAGIFKRIFHITLPSIYPIISLMFIMQIIGVFQVMYEPMMMTSGGPNNASMSLLLLGYQYGFTYMKAGHSMAVSSITFVIILALVMVYFRVQKHLEKA